MPSDTDAEAEFWQVILANVTLRPEDIIEAIVDELLMGDLAEDFPDIRVTRTGPGSLLLDYGEEGRFALQVEPQA